MATGKTNKPKADRGNILQNFDAVVEAGRKAAMDLARKSVKEATTGKKVKPTKLEAPAAAEGAKSAAIEQLINLKMVSGTGCDGALCAFACATGCLVGCAVTFGAPVAFGTLGGTIGGAGTSIAKSNPTVINIKTLQRLSLAKIISGQK